MKLFKNKKHLAWSLGLIGSASVVMLSFQNCSPVGFKSNSEITAASVGSGQSGSVQTEAVPATRTSTVNPVNASVYTTAPSTTTIQAPVGTAPAVAAGSQTQVTATTTAAPGPQVSQPAATATTAPALHLDFGPSVRGLNLRGGKYPFYDTSIQAKASQRIASKIVTLSGLPAKGALLKMGGLNLDQLDDYFGSMSLNINEEIGTVSTQGISLCSSGCADRIVMNGDRIRMYAFQSAFFNTENRGRIDLVDIDNGQLLASGSFSAQTVSDPSTSLNITSFPFTQVSWNDPGPILAQSLTISSLASGVHVPISFTFDSSIDVIYNGKVAERVGAQIDLDVKNGDTIQFRWNKPPNQAGKASGYIWTKKIGYQDTSIVSWVTTNSSTATKVEFEAR